MNVLLLDNDKERLGRVAEALGMVNSACKITAMDSLVDAEEALTSFETSYDLAIVGPDLPENPIPAVRFLRRLSPQTRVVAYDAFGLYDEIRLQRILLAGANMVFDIRMAPLKIALLLRPLLEPFGTLSRASFLAA